MHISTSVQVLCHLPLHKALPVHMSAILQSVNRLRFYRASGVPLLMKLVFCFSFFSLFLMFSLLYSSYMEFYLKVRSGIYVILSVLVYFEFYFLQQNKFHASAVFLCIL